MSAAAFAKPGITSILASDGGSLKSVSSLRRTLSADMSSQKWMAQNGLASSSEEHCADDIGADSPDSLEEEVSEGESESEPSEFNIWSSIREENMRKKTELEEPRQSDIWSSILSQKTDQPAPAAPYIHHLVKRSMSCLSEKSLEVCTESLGSESGSDGFSSYPSSETSDGEEDKEEFIEETERAVPSSSSLISKKRQLQQLTRSRSFPPPLPSLSRQNGASLHVRSHRDNGRLVLEAVSVKEQNNFRAQREDGRLVLTFVGDPSNDSDHSEEFNKGDENDTEETGDWSADFGAEDDEQDEEVKEKDVETEETGEAGNKMELILEELPKPSTGEVRVNKFAILMNKPVVLANTNPLLSDKFGEVVFFGDSKEETFKLQQSLSQMTRLAQVNIAEKPTVTTTFYGNTYDYFWRTKSAALDALTSEHPLIVKGHDNHNYIISKDMAMSNDSRELLVLRGNDADYLVPLIQSCKDTRRSLLFLGPRCIATS
ncbi:protein FAF-like, chloroplastic [Punica granatum]|uniref:FAF domain-containing protein n=2 Tax=Punica granatum TaxID=22663 RepID=A0A218W8S2_PUNGR|nr:protein FAF-like, chloroplastic [Punica granatum]OWM69046.1 hypothetical protein CDL15_Pgr025233 [Punica granatum]PKI73357.1 hypothetical protein CRG98_006295 [Punica granatum]